MAAAQDKSETISISQRVNEFIQKNRKVLFIGLVSVVALLVALIVIFTVREKVQAGNLSQVDALNRRYEALKPHVSGEGEEAVSKQPEIDALLSDLAAFQSKKSGFAAARAYGISASIYEGRKEWAEAEKTWISAAKAAGKNYFVPVSFFNAAVAAEEQGNTEAAIIHYGQALAHEKIFPAAARAQFSIGRLQESLGSGEAALDTYRTLINKWPSDPLWTNLAQSRIVVLSD